MLPQRVISTVVAVTMAAAASAAEWPQWRGPKRDGLCTETGLPKQWPEGGPRELWKLTGIGTGYSAVAIARNRFYTMGDRRTPDGKGQFVIAFDLRTRKELWATLVGRPHRDGPRCTPTVDGTRLYAIGTHGDLVCCNAADGKVVWKKSFTGDFGGKMMSVWKFSESPLVDGDQLVCTPGGPDATLVALNKATGETVWKCAVPKLGDRGKDGAGYSSIVAADIDGVRQYIQLLGRGAVGVKADNGAFLWGYNRVANGIANVPTPVVKGSHVFVSTAYGTGSALLEIVRDGERWTAKEAYWLDGDTFQNHHGGLVLVGDHLYGGHGHNAGAPVCIEFLTGKVAWKAESVGTGSAAVLYADGHLIFRYQKREVALVEATPTAFKLKGSFVSQTRGRGNSWAHPVIHDRRLYLRHGDELACYDVKAP